MARVATQKSLFRAPSRRWEAGGRSVIAAVGTPLTAVWSYDARTQTEVARQNRPQSKRLISGPGRFGLSREKEATGVCGGRWELRYETNDYSVPAAYGHRQVLVKAFVWELVISCMSEVIARHSDDGSLSEEPKPHTGGLSPPPAGLRAPEWFPFAPAQWETFLPPLTGRFLPSRL
jgi:hypothetical protein